MMAAAAATALVLVAQDGVALRAAPSDTAPQQAQLVQGDALEVRGRKLDHLQVWDHRRERAGYVRASQVKAIDPVPAQAPQLQAVMRFLRDQPGSEALGIAYAAAYLKAAPQLDAEAFDAIGHFAERLARRASRQGGALAVQQIEGAAVYGVCFQSLERDGAVQLCYDGDAWRRVLALPATAELQARAVLALTRPDCMDPALKPSDRQALLQDLAALLARVEPATLPAPVAHRLRLRRASVDAERAFEAARSAKPQPVLMQAAIDALAAVDRQQLPEDDLVDYHDTALRVGASRWAAEPVPVVATAGPLRIQPGEPGQTCVSIGDLRRCSYGVVWAASQRADAAGRTVALAVQPLAGWCELWLFRRGDTGWTVNVLPPAATDPQLGYVEFAGYVPGAAKLLLAREVRAEGRLQRRFEVLSLDSLAVEKQASNPQLLLLFGRWQDAAWKRQTVSLR